MNNSQKGIENITNKLYTAIRQTEGMVNLMVNAECFMDIPDERISDIQNTLEVCQERISSIHNLFEQMESYVNKLRVSREPEV